MLELVVLDDGFAVPRRFTSTGDAITMEIEVDPGGRGRCVRLELRAPEGEALTGEALRLPLARLIRQAIAGAARKLEPVEEGGEPVFRLVGTRRSEAAAFYERFTRDARRPRRGSPLTDDNLRQVAALYRAALERGDPPTQTIRDTMHVSRPTAARWVAKARERGFLGPALGTRAGEAR